jgi:hypothetical protein
VTIYRKPKDVPTELPSARLYLDDIEQIVQIFLDAAKAQQDRSPLPEYVKPADAEPKTTFTIRDYICNSLEELPKIANKTRQLVVEVKRYGFSAKLDVETWTTRWSSYSLAPEEELFVHHRLKSLFDDRRILWRTAVHTIPWWVASLLGLISGSLITEARPSMHPFAFLLLVAILLLWIATISGYFLNTTVILKRRHEHSARRWETAWKIIPPILTFLLGMLAQYLTHKFWPKP